MRAVLQTLLAFLGGTIAAAIVVLGLALWGVFPGLSDKVDEYVSLGRPQEPEPPPPSLGPGGRLVIPAIEVDAPIIAVSTDEAGVMQTPNSAWEVGWYDFSAPAGQAGNAVMAGHVDYHDVGPAVFWRLRELAPGAEVQVIAPDGATTARYRVTQVESYEAGAAPIEAIIGPTGNAVLTLITCDGGFDPTVRQYDRRLVVRAELVG